MGHKHRRSMQSDFVNWCKLRAKIAHAANEYEMACLINLANHMEDYWANGPHAHRWYRLQGRNPGFIAHIAIPPGAENVERDIIKAATYPVRTIEEALSCLLFRLQHMPDIEVEISIHPTGSPRFIYHVGGRTEAAAEQVVQWQSERKTLAA